MWGGVEVALLSWSEKALCSPQLKGTLLNLIFVSCSNYTKFILKNSNAIGAQGYQSESVPYRMCTMGVTCSSDINITSS